MAIPLIISIASIAFSAGLFVGLLTAKFVSKKECHNDMQEVWAQLDVIRNALIGKKIIFELKPIINE